MGFFKARKNIFDEICFVQNICRVKNCFFQSIAGIYFPSSCLEIVDTKTLSDFKYTLAFYADFCRKICFICYFRINKKYWKKNVTGKMLSTGKNSTGNVIDLQVYRKFFTKLLTHQQLRSHRMTHAKSTAKL